MFANRASMKERAEAALKALGNDLNFNIGERENPKFALGNQVGFSNDPSARHYVVAIGRTVDSTKNCFKDTDWSGWIYYNYCYALTESAGIGECGIIIMGEDYLISGPKYEEGDVVTFKCGNITVPAEIETMDNNENEGWKYRLAHADDDDWIGEDELKAAIEDKT